MRQQLPHSHHFVAQQMERTDWIENRVLWRLRQHSTAKNIAAIGDAIPPYCFAVLQNARPNLTVGKPVLAFCDSGETWTLLATERIVSMHSADVHAMDLHNGFRVASPFDRSQVDQIPNAKSDLQHLTLVAPDSETATVWAPKGASCFALWNILLMFPFKRETS